MPAWTCRLRQQRRKTLHPTKDADVIDSDATVGQQFFNVTVGEPVAQVPTNRERDHIRRQAEPCELDLNAGTRRQRRRIDQACLILLSTDTTDPVDDLAELIDWPVQMNSSPGDFDLRLVDEPSIGTCRQGRATSISGGVNRCTHRNTVTWSTMMPRSASSSSMSRLNSP